MLCSFFGNPLRASFRSTGGLMDFMIVLGVVLTMLAGLMASEIRRQH
jgi:hypothetical protein